VEKGYLVREKDPDDKRAVRIYLTDKKDEIEDLIRKIDRRAEDRMLEGFQEDEKEALRNFLERIMENLVEECR